MTAREDSDDASPRRLSLLGGTMIATLLAAQSYGAEEPTLKKAKSPRLVVFVCEHGSAKSLVAASFFERMAKERGIAVRAVSRGTAPDTSVPATVVEALRTDGFDVAASTLRFKSGRRLQLNLLIGGRFRELLGSVHTCDFDATLTYELRGKAESLEVDGREQRTLVPQEAHRQ